jgi:hypothetical protein
LNFGMAVMLARSRDVPLTIQGGVSDWGFAIPERQDGPAGSGAPNRRLRSAEDVHERFELPDELE